MRLNDLAARKAEGRPWAMLTCYDYSTARAFSNAGVEVLLVGDSAANVMYGYDTTTEVSLDELIPLARALVAAGIPVMAHIGFTPQSVNALSGFKVQGRGEGAEQLRRDARAVAEAGAHSVVLEMVPAELAKEITAELPIPTCGIGAGKDCDGQVLVWHDAFAVPSDGRRPSFAAVFGEVGELLENGARDYVAQVESRDFPPVDKDFKG